MKIISLKIDNDIFTETEEILSKTKKARNRYINEAISNYNKLYKRKLHEEMYRVSSLASRVESMSVLAEFDAAENSNEAI